MITRPNHLFAAFALGLLATSGVSPALDLTPERGFRELEGFKIPVVTFPDGPREVRWQPPASWRLSGGGTGLTLYPPERSQAAMQLRIFDRKPAAPDSADSTEELEPWARQFLPQDATEVILLGEYPSPFMLGTLPSKELIFTYVSQSQRFSIGVAVADLDERQRFVLLVTARTRDFTAVHDEAVASMFSWEWRTARAATAN